MSPGLLGLSAAIAVVALVIAYAVVWTNRTPTVERDEDEILPLFSGLGRGNALDSHADASLVAAAETRAQQAVAQAAARAAASVASAQVVQAASADAASVRAASAHTAPTAVTPAVSAAAPAPAPVPAAAAPAPVSPTPAVTTVAPSAPPAAPPSAPTFVAAPAPAPTAAPPAAPTSPSFAPPSRIAAEFANDFSSPARTTIERELIHYTLPTEGTLQFLPGRLEVASGQDSGREIRFVRLPGPNGTEFTFGRSEGEPYRHIRLRDQTVSREHARMRFAAGRWFIQSLSQTNPVIYDGHALQQGEERVLEDGTRLEMGEVLLAFRHR